MASSTSLGRAARRACCCLPVPTARGWTEGLSTTAQDGIVYILDDEPEMVKALTRLLRARRFEVLGFTAVRAFLEASAFVKSFQSIEWRHCFP